jgi:hypothetical protein
VDSQVTLNGQRVFGFDATISLQANENLFIFFFNNSQPHPVTILGGSFSVSFSSRYKASQVWAMTMWDAYRLLVERNNTLASAGAQTFNVQAASQLLQQELRIVVTSGDAARASTDPNYYLYFNQATINPANPGNQLFNAAPFIGPALKTCIADLFDSANPLLGAALGPLSNGQTETLFLEKKSAVFNPSVITMTLDKVANLKVSIATDYFYNWLKIGYPEQQYDEKSGKFEFNNTNQYQGPIKTIAKVLELVSKYRADSDGFEFARYNTQGGKSTTYNSSDNSAFMLSVDFTSFIYAYFEAQFVSNIPNPDSATTTNQKLIANQAYQPVSLTITDGQFLVNNIDFAILMFNQPAPGGQTVEVTFTALLNGLPGDSATIRMFVNGTEIRTWSQVLAGVNTPFNVDDNNFRFFNKGDNIYFTVETVKTCSVTITSFSLNIGAGYFIASSAGNIDVPASSTGQLISLPLITATMVTIGGLQIPVVSAGFQYFRFLSPVHNTNFDWIGSVAGYLQGPSGQHLVLDVWKNGVNIGTITYAGNANVRAPFNHGDNTSLAGVLFSGNFDFKMYDIVWLTASVENATVWITYADLKFTSSTIKAYNLLRPAFDSVRGIPNPETAFNIVPFSPARMIDANKDLIAVGIFNQAPGQLTFQTADKNQYLSTTEAGQTITENANIDVHNLGDPLFYPFLLDLDTEVSDLFNDLLQGQANGHIEVICGTKKLYGYPMKVSSKPAYNESQSWQLLVSTRTNLADLVGLDWDGLIPLQNMDSLIPIFCPVKCVPLNMTLDERFNSASMDEDWFKNRYADWFDNSDYFNPWEQDDTIPWQFQSNGLDPVMIQVLDGDGNFVGDPIVVPNVATTSLPGSQKLYQLDMSLEDFEEGCYYFLITFGIGEGMASWISEPIQVAEKWPNTCLVRYRHSRNMLGVVFSNGYSPCIRIPGKLMRFTPKSKYTQFTDQNQDADALGAQAYRTWKFQAGNKDSLIPDYIMEILEAIMDLDTVFVNSVQISRDGDTDWNWQTWTGQPKVLGTIDVRRAKNSYATILNTAGQLTDDMSGGYTVEAAAFGQSLDGQNFIQTTND